jgi:hypothetical protein
MITTLIGTPDPEPEDKDYEKLAAAYKRERKEAEKSVAQALYVPLAWISKHKPR